MLQGLMEQTFGPKDGADSGERMQRGLEEMARLSVARPDFVRRWLHETPPAEAPPANTERLCFRCGAGGAAATCAKCGVACYCSRECQKADWGKGGAFGGHKSLCERYKWLGREQRVPPEEHRTILTELITRTKLYVCPFFVHHAEQKPGTTESGESYAVVNHYATTTFANAVHCHGGSCHTHAGAYAGPHGGMHGGGMHGGYGGMGSSSERKADGDHAGNTGMLFFFSLFSACLGGAVGFVLGARRTEQGFRLMFWRRGDARFDLQGSSKPQLSEVI